MISIDQTTIEHYEQLRLVASGQSQATVIGWALFMHQGMWAWLQALQQPVNSTNNLTSCTATAARSEIIKVLAAMVVPQLQEHCHD